MTAWVDVRKGLAAEPKHWLVTGAAGFIGSHIVEDLLRMGQVVTGLDNFATGHRHNLEDVRKRVQTAAWDRFRLIEGDVRDPAACAAACEDVDHVLHQAALGSVPRSIADPAASAAANIDGFIQVVLAARTAGVGRVVYASSSSVYGDHVGLPKIEDRIGAPLSPYAVTKLADEHLAAVFARVYELELVGLRYFNVFGPRQDPEGPYAAVVPRWIRALLRGERATIFGDGETTRDFTYVANAIQANVLAALAKEPEAARGAYNVAVGERSSLNGLYELIAEGLRRRVPDPERIPTAGPIYEDFRAGDVRHSLADVGRATRLLGYEPTHDLAGGMDETLDWFVSG